VRDDARQRRCSWGPILRELLALPTRLTLPGAPRRRILRRFGLTSLPARARHVIAQHEHVGACEPFQLAELCRRRSVAAAVTEIGRRQPHHLDGPNDVSCGRRALLACDRSQLSGRVSPW